MTEAIKYILCPECDGTREQMEMVCYGGPPVERMVDCEFCKGEGKFEEADYLIIKLGGKI